VVYHIPEFGRKSHEGSAGRLIRIRVLAVREHESPDGFMNDVFLHVESLSARTVCDAAEPLRLFDLRRGRACTASLQFVSALAR
jgi:hypothetical protein